MEICKACPLNNKGVCDKNRVGKAITTFIYKGEIRQINKDYKGCGCPLEQKAKSPDSQCPLGKF